MLTQRGPYGADDAGHVIVGEYQKIPIEISLQTMFSQTDQSGHIITEDRPFGAIDRPTAIDFRTDGWAENAGRTTTGFRKFDTAFTEQDLCIDDIHLFIQRLFE